MKLINNLLLLFVFFIGVISSANAQNYLTLPKNVRMFFARNVQSNVQSSYNQSASETPYKYAINADIENLRDLNDETMNEVIALFDAYPEAQSLLSLGRYQLDAKARVEVNAYAFGYGINDRLTAYVGLPIYDARVRVDYKTIKKSTGQELADYLTGIYGDDRAQAYGQIVEQVYDIDAGIIQSAFVNSLGYQELGNWQGSGLGDLEFGLFYNFLKEPTYGAYTKLGGNAPTGYVDDPDIIQDIGFGDGQWDAYLEVGGGVRAHRKIFLEAETRFTYQFASDKRLRVPLDPEIPLSDETDTFTEKLGNRMDSAVRAVFTVNDWIRIEPGMLFQYTEKARYFSNNTEANDILATNTDASARSFRIDARFTTADLFRMGKFPLPAQITLSAQNMVEGRNIAKTDLVEFEFRMFF